MAIEWVASVNRYRDSETGQFVSQDSVDNLLEKARTDTAKRLTDLADQLNAETITPDQWEAKFKAILKDSSITQYSTGRGGIEQMSPKDYGRVGRYLRDQYKYLGGFKNALPELTANQVRARSVMYASSTKLMAARGEAAGWVGMPDLPAYPTQGSECIFNCGCGWIIIKLKTPGSWNCTWKRTKKESCPTCLEREKKWNPLKIRKGVILNP